MLKIRLLLPFYLISFLQQAAAYPIQMADKQTENFQTVDAYFQQIRSSKERLTEFFAAFPKGGDLHHHFMGSPPPAILLQEGISRSLCLNKEYSFIHCASGEISALNVSQSYPMEQAFNRAMTTIFDPDIPLFTRHADFFSAFAKTIELYDRLPVSFISNIRQRAVRESLYYIESTTYWSERDGPSQLFSLLESLPPLLPLTTASMTTFMNQLTQLSAFQQQVETAAQTFQQGPCGAGN